MIADDATLARLAGLAQQGDKAAYAALLGAARLWLVRYYPAGDAERAGRSG